MTDFLHDDDKGPQQVPVQGVVNRPHHRLLSFLSARGARADDVSSPKAP